jgi:hypothetical protein
MVLMQSCNGRGQSEISDKFLFRPALLRGVRQPEDESWMPGKTDGDIEWASFGSLAPFLHRQPGASQRKGGCCTQSKDETRSDQHYFLYKPPAALLNFMDGRCLVQTVFTAWSELEMLNRIGQPDAICRDPGLRERTAQDLSRRSGERTSFEILAVARLLTDNHQGSLRISLTANRLRCVLAQAAALAGCCRKCKVGHAVKFMRHPGPAIAIPL